MKTTKTRRLSERQNGQVIAEKVTVKGKPMVILPEREYERLMQRADEWEPQLPAADAEGNVPAVAYARASLARKIIRHRRRVGLSQVELARLAGVRSETLCRIEGGQHTPAVATIDKIDKALRDAKARDAS
jgi:DNA-binding XRE family transcriptional regulator